MAFLGGWLGPAFQVLNGQRAAQMQGDLQGRLLKREMDQQDADRAQKAKADALELQLAQLKLDQGKLPQEWHPTSEQEALDYEKAQHPESVRNIDPLSDQGITQALKKRRGEIAIAPSTPKPPSQAVQNDTAEGAALLDRYVNRGAQGATTDAKGKSTVVDPQGVAQVGAFGAAFQAIRRKNPTMAPELVAKRAMDSMKTSDPELFRKESEDDRFSTSSYPAPSPGTTVTKGAVQPVAPAQPTQANGGTIPVKNPQNREAMAQRWDELTQGGMDPQQATQKVLQEFQGK